VDEVECALIGRTGVVDAIQPGQQLRPRCMQVVVLVELEAVDQLERGLDVAGFRGG